MELRLVIETVAGWVRTNELAIRRWHELPDNERGVVDRPAVCDEQADMLARTTSLETLEVYGDALRGTLAVLTRVQAAHTAEVTVRWSRVSVPAARDDAEVHGDDNVGGQQQDDRLAKWAERHGLTTNIELLEQTNDPTQVTGISETWKATIVTPNGEIGARTTTDGFEPDALDLLFGAWAYESPNVGELAACFDVLGSEATMELVALFTDEAKVDV